MKASYIYQNSLARLNKNVEKLALFGAACFLLFWVPSLAAERSVREAPAFSMTLMTDAQRFLKEGKWNEAVTAFKQLAKESPGSFSIDMGLARALFQAGNRQEALIVLDRIAKRESRGNLSLVIKRIDIVSKSFLTKENFQAYQDGINFLLVDKVKEAKKAFEKALDLEPDNVEILLRLVQSQVADQDWDRALENVKKIEKLNPHEFEMKLWKGRLAFLQGQQKKAGELFLEIRPEMDDSEHFMIWYSELLWGQGNRKEALEYLSRNLKRHPWNILALLQLAKLRLTKGFLNDSKIFLESRKDLQVALSRLDSLGPAITYQKKNHLDRIFYQRTDLKTEIQNYLNVIDERLSEISRVKFSKPAKEST